MTSNPTPIADGEVEARLRELKHVWPIPEPVEQFINNLRARLSASQAAEARIAELREDALSWRRTAERCKEEAAIAIAERNKARGETVKAVEAERESCAKIAYDLCLSQPEYGTFSAEYCDGHSDGSDAAQAAIAASIRARSKGENDGN